MTERTLFEQVELPETPVGIPAEDFVPSDNVLYTQKSLVVKNNFTANEREVVMNLGQKFKRVGFSGSSYSAAVTDYCIGITSLALAPTIGLPRPSLVGPGKIYIVKDEVGGAASTTITIRSVGEENIDGASSTTLNVNYSAKMFYTDGANWFIY